MFQVIGINQVLHLMFQELLRWHQVKPHIIYLLILKWASLVAQLVKMPADPCVRKISWKMKYLIPWTVQSMGSQRVRHNCATFTFILILKCKYTSVQFSSVAQYVRLCDPVNCSTRPPCPSPTPAVHPNPCPLSW